MTFDQEDHPRIELSPNPLKVVVAQVRYPAQFRLGSAEGLAAVQARVAARYPVSMPAQQQINFSIGPGGANAPVITPGPPRFSDESGTHIVTIGPEWTGYETTDYDSWPEFKRRFREVLEVLDEQGRPPRINRLGLRFVDELAFDGVVTVEDWQTYIAPSLLGAAGAPQIDARTRHSVHVTDLAMDGAAIRLRHEYSRNEAGSSPASTYLIDNDAFSDRNQPWDIDALLGQSDTYHDWAWKLFRRSLTDATIELLKVEVE